LPRKVFVFSVVLFVVLIALSNYIALASIGTFAVV